MPLARFGAAVVVLGVCSADFPRNGEEARPDSTARISPGLLA
eukprot:CAMPEP_0119331050 /NCGR_PEP_ID=MMETSP1333-20130426/79660_1 /TAXON_ID=418940 /ORGANISM="Scyphosphaera apsteinii, Strain RCC1455" /LENGTH=41 /DNA_ID= /DNA_START= /DNA_END= /DNA_ORIENTATION=